MYGIAAIVGLIFCFLFALSRKEEKREGSGIHKFFLQMAEFLWRIAEDKIPGKAESVRRDIEALNPQRNIRSLFKEYYVGKAARFLEIIFAGTLTALLIKVRSTGTEIGEGGILDRGSFSEGSRSIILTSDGKDSYDLILSPYLFSEEEVDLLYEDFRTALQKIMLGENESVDCVRENLIFETELEGYPFQAEWESNRPEIVNALGEVSEVCEPETVVLTRKVFYGERQWEDMIEITVCAPDLTAEESRRREIQILLERTEEESRTERKYILPKEYQGEKLDWKLKTEDNSILIWCGTVCLGVLLFFVSDKDLHSDLERRRELIKRDYPDIVQKFVLYMGAGMTARNTLKKLALDYEESKGSGEEAKPAYEEILFSYRELLSGIPEAKMYERLGRRTGTQEYIRLSTLLQQNAQKGNSAILDRLREEAKKSMAEKLQNGRKLGEEAGTKLLLPMVMMLLVAMVIIMIPVFLTSMI